VATERDDSGVGGSSWATRRAIALALALAVLVFGGLYWLIFRGPTAASVARSAPTLAPTPQPTADAWAPPAIVIVLRESSSAQVAANHGAHLLHATVHWALAASPRSKVAVLHNAPAHM
jgi:zona occludens toxin (predicted ATPase)